MISFVKVAPFDERSDVTDEADMVSFPKFIAREQRGSAPAELQRPLRGLNRLLDMGAS
jgi:hypothetical protein